MTGGIAGKRAVVLSFALAASVLALLLVIAAPAVIAADVAPDLVITGVRGPEACTQGDAIQITCTVKNQGNAAAGPFLVSIMLSPDQNITSSDIYLRQFYKSGLSKGSSSSEKVEVLIQGNVPDGQYFIGAIADPAGDVAEQDETNNAGYSEKTIFIWGNYTGAAIPAWTMEPPFDMGYVGENSTEEAPANASEIEAEIAALVAANETAGGQTTDGGKKGIPGFEAAAVIAGLAVAGYVRSLKKGK